MILRNSSTGSTSALTRLQARDIIMFYLDGSETILAFRPSIQTESIELRWSNGDDKLLMSCKHSMLTLDLAYLLIDLVAQTNGLNYMIHEDMTEDKCSPRISFILIPISRIDFGQILNYSVIDAWNEYLNKFPHQLSRARLVPVLEKYAQAGITTVKDLVEHSEEALLQMPDFGPKRITKIKEMLTYYGLQLGMNMNL